MSLPKCVSCALLSFCLIDLSFSISIIKRNASPLTAESSIYMPILAGFHKTLADLYTGAAVATIKSFNNVENNNAPASQNYNGGFYIPLNSKGASLMTTNNMPSTSTMETSASQVVPVTLPSVNRFNYLPIGIQPSTNGFGMATYGQYAPNYFGYPFEYGAFSQFSPNYNFLPKPPYGMMNLPPAQYGAPLWPVQVFGRTAQPTDNYGTASEHNGSWYPNPNTLSMPNDKPRRPLPTNNYSTLPKTITRYTIPAKSTSFRTHIYKTPAKVKYRMVIH